MINSMTGYGSAEGRTAGALYLVEIRTVNNRYFKANIRLPDAVMFLEGDIESLLRKELSRGMVNYTLRLKDVPVEALFEINERALESLVKRMSTMAQQGDLGCQIDMAALLAVPGILVPAMPDEKLAALIRRKVVALTRQAMKGLKQMRAVEGAALAAELGRHCGAIARNLDKIRDRAPVGPKLYADKLKKRVDELLAAAKLKLDDVTVAREVAIFADRADISEEIARLDSHLRQFDDTLKTDMQAGRKLDFICQEMLREANTIASKACDAETVQHVVDMKCWVERIKEQIQNIE